jgi:transcriptional regulator with XRE-family HTH domain
MTYNESLRKARLTCGYSQNEVASKLGVSKMQISKWETGDGSAPNISRLIQLADVYGTSIDKLVGRI